MRQCTEEGATCTIHHLEVGALITEVLDGLLFSSAVPESQDALEVWSSLVCTGAGLAWCNCAHLADSADFRGKGESLHAAASQLWATGGPLRDLQDLIPVQVYTVLENLAGTLLVC